ncbi:ribosome hibernation-promoting factor, HPF/YfiA family [Peribacillus sp. SCS-37]|uniref:ribosome hibernation-promoting factor, HPF/YfiA family n=1 Tax=Paraperibacillus esterisolvens TaxID=3115296 RepID=UPI003905AB7D
MNYNVRGENIEVTQALRDYVEKKIGKLERYFNDTPNANVHVNLKVYNDKSTKVEVTIPMSDLVLRAEESNGDMYAAIDLITDKLERQIRKHKTKVNRKVREKGGIQDMFVSRESEAEASAAVVDLEDDNELEVVRNKRFDLKPMDSEEAILQMNMLGHSFFVFTNAETNVTNVVYKRNDGRYGLIEPS